jgi:ribosomal protein S18 acetylase RimI-like enzyme
MIRLRKPKLDDGAIYRIIVEELVPHSQTRISEEELSPRGVTRRLNRNVTYVLARGNRRPGGFISFLVKDGRLYIDMIALSAEEQHHGWGSLLMEAAENYGRRRKCPESVLFVDDTNGKAQRFYARRGYRVVQYLPAIRCYQLSKPL